MDYCFYELKKYIVMVFHAIEDKDGDQTRLRIKVEGQTKNNVWETQDLGGFVEMIGNRRTIGFSNCERYFAKGTRGVHGVIPIPDLTPTSPNNFLALLFEQYNAKSADEVAEANAQKEAYEAAMDTARTIIATVKDAESANAAVGEFKSIDHALTSKRESTILWNKHIKKLNLFFDKVLNEYTPAPEEAEGK